MQLDAYGLAGLTHSSTDLAAGAGSTELTLADGRMYLFKHWRWSMSKAANLTVQQWRNSLAVRIPAKVA